MGKNTMNNNMIGLKSRDDGRALALQSVKAHGQLQGPLLRMKLRQVYRNTTHDNLECVYTFPLAWRSVLLGMAVELNGQRMTGTVVDKKDAETTYEKAIQSGDLPVMLERSGKDLYTANLGNILPGDEVVIEIDYAQVQRLEGGLLRMSLPTTIAPCFGDEHTQGGLAPHQTAAASPLAEYRLHVSLDIANPLAHGTIASPSHDVQRVKHHKGVTVKLQNKAWLDRDFVLTIHGLKDMTFAMASADATQPGQYTLLTTAVAHWDTALTRPAPLRMKVLVDGSGSMQGDSNEQARDALDWLFHQLQTDDEVSMTRFGSETLHVLPRLQSCTEAYQRRLRAEARNIQADLGGTEMDDALRKVIAIAREDEEPLPSANILLITDGDVWNIENIVTTVRLSGHRLFALGVGSAPAESLLRELAEVSGGACEMVSPNQNMQQAVARLLQRMRHSCAVACNLVSDGPLLYQSPGPREITQGDTLHQWAQVSSRPSSSPTLQWTRDGQTMSRQAEQLMWDEDSVLPRLRAAQQLLDTPDEIRQRELALQYQLVTPHTHFILVHSRAEGEKAQDLPLLQQVVQMQAAGWGGNGTVMRDVSVQNVSMRISPSTTPSMARSVSSHVAMSTPTIWRSSRTHAAGRIDSMANAGLDDIEIPAFLRQSPDGVGSRSPRNQRPITPPLQPTDQASEKSTAGTPEALSKETLRQQQEKKYQDQIAHLSKVLHALDKPHNPLTEMLQNFNAQACDNRNFRAALSVALRTSNTSFMADLILHHAKTLGSPALFWAVLLLWLADEKNLPLDRHARRLLEVELANVDSTAKDALVRKLVTAGTRANDGKVA
jgi:Ca-activated chloride channel family protein